MWKILESSCPVFGHTNQPSCEKLADYFETLSNPFHCDYFDMSYEADAANYINSFHIKDPTNDGLSEESRLELDVINSLFSKLEIEDAIDCLKNNKSPGADNIPAEFIKCSKDILSEPITEVLNYIIEKRDFPQCWAEGVRSTIYKGGNSILPENYRGITILPILEKVFEIAVYRRLSFVNEAFCKVDEHNGGFLNGRRTSDNLFIITGLAQRQLLLGNTLYLCFIDFSKAFDLINRNILFYKIMKSGWHGKVIETLRSLYQKTNFRIKHQGLLSFSMRDIMGVNQGGVASGLLFRKYMADLDMFLNTEFGVCIGEMIIAHILWADDLILMSDTPEGLQHQLNGLFKFCSKNLLVVNAVKTKCMTIGDSTPLDLHFNGNKIEQVIQYKYLGNILKSINNCNADMFANTYPYLCDQGRKAIFSMLHKLREILPLPPKVMFKLFDSIIKPILIYGSDVWGHNKSGLDIVDKVMLRYCRRVLNVKAATSNLMVYRECGMLPPSIQCTISTMCYMNRLYHMPADTIAKHVYEEMHKLHPMGFRTWVTRVNELIVKYDMDITKLPSNFRTDCKTAVIRQFKSQWGIDIHNIETHPILRTYNKFKCSFGIEPYLNMLKNHKYRTAVSQLRTSSHTLAIERGRHSRPKVHISDRTCNICGVLEDETHFLIHCSLYRRERETLFSIILKFHHGFSEMFLLALPKTTLLIVPNLYIWTYCALQ